jgi:hypothetical protein
MLMPSDCLRCQCVGYACSGDVFQPAVRIRYEESRRRIHDVRIEVRGKADLGKAGSARDILVAAWSPDSKRLLFVEEDGLAIQRWNKFQFDLRAQLDRIYSRWGSTNNDLPRLGRRSRRRWERFASEPRGRYDWGCQRVDLLGRYRRTTTYGYNSGR